MHQLKTSTKLFLLAFSMSILMALLGGLGVFNMHRMEAQILGGLSSAQTENGSLVAVENAHAHFKIQVQEWKNILIRGNDPASFEKYVAQFS